MIALYHQIKTLISFLYRRGLNPRSLIQPSETLLIELIGTYTIQLINNPKKKKFDLMDGELVTVL